MNTNITSEARKASHFLLTIIQGILDLSLYELCFYLAPVSLTFENNIFLAGIMLVFFLFNKLYGFYIWTFWDETEAVMHSVLMIFLVSALFIYTSRIDLPFIYLAVCIVVFMPLTLAVRYFFRRIFFAMGLLSTTVIILGAGNAGKLFAENIASSPFISRKVIAFLDDDPAKQGKIISGVPVLGTLSDFELIQSELNTDEAIIAISTASREKLAEILDKVEEHIGRVMYIPDMYMLSTYTANIRSIDGLPVISATQGLLNPVNRFIKSVMNYAGGLIALILASPIMLIAAVKIKREDKGPVFFRHRRVGQNLEPFRMFKFRTMVPNAEKILDEMLKDEKLKKEFDEAFKFKDDPRVTKFGKILRRTSLDELPQIFNVLRGEMSLVGPRPIVQDEVNRFYGKRTAMQIFHVKPGMTGYWQISGRNDVKDYAQRIDFDLYYIHNWSIWMDIIIMLRTIKVIITGKGAY